MAATGKTSQEADSDSSSSAEDLERFREAAWEPPGSVKKTVQTVKNCENPASPVIPSLRVRPNSHEHDGNELQTTPEFRTHVAKKLAAMLDNCIKEIPGSNSFNQESESEDEGFRLLSTSVPGDPGKIIPSPTLKRRVASSTSEDSEEEKLRRFREAAVSGLDILKHSALQTAPVDIMDRGSNNQPKKKKKKKAKKERRLSDEAETSDQNAEPEGKMVGLKKKKKKERMNDKTETGDQMVNSEDKRSKNSKSESVSHNRIETVKDESKKKKMGIWETASDPNISPTCGKSETKKKKKLVVDSCNEHD